MAILGQITIDEILVLSVDADPAVASTPAPIGSFATLDDDTNGRMWLKTGAANNAWSIIPRKDNGTAYQTGAIVFADSNGFLTGNTAKIYWDNTNNRLSLGANAPSTPQSTIHIDRSNATGGHVRFTAGTTTGQAAGDGTEMGIDDTGAAEIRQYENSNINFYTNNTIRGAFANTGQFLLGSTTPIDITGASALPQFQIIGTAAVQMAGIQYSADTIGPVFNLIKSRNASIGGQTVLVADDEFGRIQFRGSDGTNFMAGASIRALVDGTPGTNSMPGRLIMMTTPSGSTTPVERARITQDGQFIHSANVRLGDHADTTDGNMVLRSSEFLGRMNSVWRTLAIAPIVFTSGTGSLSTTSATFSTITGLTTTPAAGTYLVYYSVQASITANSSGNVSIFLAGNEQVETTRGLSITNSLGTSTNASGLSAFTVLTVNGSQVVDVRFRENGGGTFAVTSKIFLLIPIAR